MENWPQNIALIFSGIALVVSCTTAWLTLFRRGTLKMARPNTIYFGSDGGIHGDKSKIYLRGLLYSTSKRGQLIENMHVRLKRGESVQNFSVWVHGESTKLVRGSGLFVGENGVVTDHHFLLSPDDRDFCFKSGTYEMQVICHIVGQRHPLVIFKADLKISDQQSDVLKKPSTGLYFDWGSESRTYYPTLDMKRIQSSPQMIANPIPVADHTNTKTEN